MKIILLKDVKGVGRRFEEKNVSDGYATNSLLPKGLAVAANASGAAQIKALKEQEATRQTQADASLESAVKTISGTTLEVGLKANEQEHLFEKLTAEKLSDILKREKGLEIAPKHFGLREPIKQTGTYEVPVEIGGKETKFTLVVVRA